MHIRNNNILQTAVVPSYIELSKMMMKKMWVWMWLTLLTSGRCHGCFEEERSGLLEIKALINPNSIFGHLSDWTANKELDIANCCEWYGIKCDSTTRRVIQLSLAGARDFRPGDWVLNASLFLPFKELQGLNLSRNRLVGCFENEGFEVLSSELRKLNVLDLSGNRFSNNLVSCFNGFSSLKSWIYPTIRLNEQLDNLSNLFLLHEERMVTSNNSFSQKHYLKA
ncbi:hypothetical protein DKX38_006863 [Salix brachista]|uniref:Leucine-rich repeat-containing N-terminal plant-type domain-containing protein n=1 Tax=Salix brachista TaxID=2182728 RepID=A0A5N5MLL0_9ROSI|nr:hypothetical protein DKX38_006863 [Salix brachista]